MSNALLWIVQIVSLFLRNARDRNDCPDGICDEPLATAEVLTSQLKEPTVDVGLFGIIRFLRCFPMDRVWDVVGRIKAMLEGCDRCPDGDCSFFDLISCIDIEEAVAIAKEVLSIIADSKFCIDGEGNDEITLGEVALN